MGLEQSMDISVSAINAARVNMELISSNLANIDTTRTETGGPYRRKIAVFAEKPLIFSDVLSAAQKKKAAGGVEITDIVDDPTPFQRVYNPGHPDADAQGYVSLPNISMAKEMVDMVYVEKVYEANITAFNASKKMAQDSLSIQ
jgi:flagellar basal-body rod protein FlgC